MLSLCQCGKGFQAHVSPTDSPLVVLFEEERANQAHNGAVVREDLNAVGAALDLADDPFECVRGTDFGSVVGEEAHVGEDIVLDSVLQLGETRKTIAELVSHVAPLFASGVLVFLDEHGLQQRADRAALARPDMREGVAEEVNEALLPGGTENLGGDRLQVLMSVRDDQLEAPPAATGELAREVGPERFGLRRADGQAEHFAPAIGVESNGDYHRDRDDPSGIADFHVGDVDPEMRPVALDWAFEKGVHLLIDLAAEPRDLAIGNAGRSERLDQIVDGGGRHPLHVGFLKDRRERLLGATPRPRK